MRMDIGVVMVISGDFGAADLVVIFNVLVRERIIIIVMVLVLLMVLVVCTSDLVVD